MINDGKLVLRVDFVFSYLKERFFFYDIKFINNHDEILRFLSYLS